MKSLMGIFFFCGLLSCRQSKVRLEEIGYLKIMVFGDAGKVNTYNKGLGAYEFANFDLANDSVIYRIISYANHDLDDFTFKTYAGKITTPHYSDTLLQLIQSLNWRPNDGIKYVNDGNAYDGIKYYVEYKWRDSIRYFRFIEDENDTTKLFNDFFRRGDGKAWRTNEVANEVVDIDKEVVTAMKRLSVYEKQEMPFLLPECGNEIDFKALTGTWRNIYSSRDTPKDYFRTITFTAKDSFFMYRYDKGAWKELIKGTYIINKEQNTITFTNQVKTKLTHTLKKLTDSCYQAWEGAIEPENQPIKYIRLSSEIPLPKALASYK